ncbi:VOC family protein [Arsenicicoccus dermatophilus]|uniref:VOC family protein n=1 Tax=Arsenicicoccus dermatophilus TaxID=1076331 RepID=UPI001F4D135E|nr:VOC family protein [Arsenicicoccus dermatophilus]MCH8614131.1 VOC family protein [Arsenicicoccus dermatophilus]
MVAVGSMTQLVLECADVHGLAEFWAEVLDLEHPAATDDEDWLTLEWAPVGRLSFRRVDGYQPPAWPGSSGESQMHFDLLVPDFIQADLAVLDAGGRPLTEVLDPGPKAWRVYSDPAGHPFCLVSVPE